MSSEVHGAERILLRNQFYWKNYRALALSLYLMLILLLFLVGFIVYQRYVWPRPQYFATTPDGRPIPVVRLDVPLYENDTFVINWSINAIKHIYAMDFVTYRATLQSSEKYFTQKGYQDYLKALLASTNLEAVKAKRQVVSITVTGQSEVTRKGQVDPSQPYSWDIQIPVMVRYENSENEFVEQKGVILMRVMRTSLLKYAEGIAISQLVLQAS